MPGNILLTETQQECMKSIDPGQSTKPNLGTKDPPPPPPSPAEPRLTTPSATVCMCMMVSSLTCCTSAKAQWIHLCYHTIPYKTLHSESLCRKLRQPRASWMDGRVTIGSASRCNQLRHLNKHQKSNIARIDCPGRERIKQRLQIDINIF